MDTLVFQWRSVRKIKGRVGVELGEVFGQGVLFGTGGCEIGQIGTGGYGCVYDSVLVVCREVNKGPIFGVAKTEGPFPLFGLGVVGSSVGLSTSSLAISSAVSQGRNPCDLKHTLPVFATPTALTP